MLVFHSHFIFQIPGQTSCNQCPSSKYSDTYGAAACKLCKQGSQAENPGLLSSEFGFTCICLILIFESLIVIEVQAPALAPFVHPELSGIRLRSIRFHVTLVNPVTSIHLQVGYIYLWGHKIWNFIFNIYFFDNQEARSVKHALPDIPQMVWGLDFVCAVN